MNTDRAAVVREALRVWCDFNEPLPGSRGAEAFAALDGLVAERDEARAAVSWFENHFVDEDGEPDGLTLAEMFERVYRWGDAAWAQAGAAESSRDRLAAALRALIAAVDPLMESKPVEIMPDGLLRYDWTAALYGLNEVIGPARSALSSFGSGGTGE